MPIIWHVMKGYSFHGFNEFIVCLGYKGYVIKEFFANYFLHKSNVTIDMVGNTTTYHDSTAEPWKITLVDTGLETMTGGRIKRIKKYVESQTFMLTYGDGVGDIDINTLLRFHKNHGKMCTVTSVQPSGRFGAICLDDSGLVNSFAEKPKGDGSWVNGGFFVCQPEVFDYLGGDKTIWEREPMEMIAAQGQMMAYRHDGFWKPMDTLRDKLELEKLWQTGAAPWKIW
jgi:glucose-1-phosphate cytidylyltransferase